LSHLLIVQNLAGTIMKRFTEGEARTQFTLLPECLDDHKWLLADGATGQSRAPGDWFKHMGLAI